MKDDEKEKKKFKFLAFQIFEKFRYFVEHLKLASFCTKLILTNFVKNVFVGRQLVLYSFFPLIYIGLNNLYLKIAFGKYFLNFELIELIMIGGVYNGVTYYYVTAKFKLHVWF